MRAALAAIAAAVLLTGCPGNSPQGDVSQHSEPQTSTSVRNPQAVPENTTRMNPMMPPVATGGQAGVASTNIVHVTLTEYEIAMPDALAPGHQMLEIENNGKQNHNFAIEGPGVQTKLASDLTRGDKAQIAVDLRPGTYTVYCPVDGHRGKGMQRILTVR